MKQATTKIANKTPNREAAGFVDGKFCTTIVEPGKAKVLRRLPPGVMVMHNHGPGRIYVEMGDTNLDFMLRADDTKMTQIHETVEFTAFDEDPAILKFLHVPE